MRCNENDEIIISEAEHASNILPWYRVADEKKAKIVFVPLDNEGRITTENLLKVITPKTKIISLSAFIVSGLISAISYTFDPTVDFNLGVAFFIFVLVGSIVGGILFLMGMAFRFVLGKIRKK